MVGVGLVAYYAFASKPQEENLMTGGGGGGGGGGTKKEVVITTETMPSQSGGSIPIQDIIEPMMQPQSYNNDVVGQLQDFVEQQQAHERNLAKQERDRQLRTDRSKKHLASVWEKTSGGGNAPQRLIDMLSKSALPSRVQEMYIASRGARYRIDKARAESKKQAQIKAMKSSWQWRLASNFKNLLNV